MDNKTFYCNGYQISKQTNRLIKSIKMLESWPIWVGLPFFVNLHTYNSDAITAQPRYAIVVEIQSQSMLKE